MNRTHEHLPILNLVLAALMICAATAPTPAAGSPSVRLEWSSTTGAGFPGSAAIEALPGDELTLDVIVDNDATGFSGASVSLAWDATKTDFFYTDGDCPSPPNIAPGVCASGLIFFTPFNPGVTLSPGMASSFDAFNLTSPDFSGTSFVIGRITFFAGESDVVSVEYVPGLDGVLDGFQNESFPDATAEIDVLGCADYSFDPADWVATPLFQIGCEQPATATQEFVSGNAYREMTHYPCTGQLRVFHEYTGCSFDPSTLPSRESLEIVEYRESRRVVSAPVAAAAINASPALIQDGVVYTHTTNFFFTSTSWISMSDHFMTAADFVQWNGSAQPDLSETGGEIRFGYIRHGGQSFDDPLVHAIDDWSVRTSHPVTYAPEPGVGLSIAAGGVFLARLRARRPRSRRTSRE